jgi:predicted MFS family arabinose efflux permease
MAIEECTIPAPAAAASRSAARRPRLTGSEWVLLLVLAAMQFTHALDFSIMMPLELKLQSDLHISHAQFTFAVGAYGFGAGISGLFAAKLLDRFDRKKSLLLLYMGFTVGTFLCAIAPDFLVLLFGRAVAGGFAGVLGANVLTIVTDVIPESRRATGMSVVMSSFSVASIVGIFVGLETAQYAGWRAPFMGLVLLCLPALVLAWRLLPPLRRHLERRPAHGVSLLQVIRNPRHLRAYALTSTLILGSWMILPTLADYLVKNLHWPDSELRWVYLCGGVASLLLMTPTGWLADSHGKLTVFRVIGLFCIVPVLLITNLPETSMPVVLLVTTLFMVATNLRWVPVMAMISTSAAPHQRGPFLSVNASVQQIVMGVASVISGLLVVEREVVGEGGVTTEKLFGYPLVGLLAAASMLVAVFLGGRLRRAPHEETQLVPETVVEPAIF